MPSIEGFYDTDPDYDMVYYTDTSYAPSSKLPGNRGSQTLKGKAINWNNIGNSEYCYDDEDPVTIYRRQEKKSGSMSTGDDIVEVSGEKSKSRIHCPIDCKVQQSGWGGCSKSCGGGVKTRTVNVIQEAQHGGRECTAEEKKTQQQCNTNPCPVNCEMSGWGGWSACSQPCGPGKQTRTRQVIKPAQHGGNACGPVSQQQNCNLGTCITYSSSKKDCTQRESVTYSDCTSADRGFGLAKNRYKIKTTTYTNNPPQPSQEQIGNNIITYSCNPSKPSKQDVEYTCPTKTENVTCDYGPKTKKGNCISNNYRNCGVGEQKMVMNRINTYNGEPLKDYQQCNNAQTKKSQSESCDTLKSCCVESNEKKSPDGNKCYSVYSQNNGFGAAVNACNRDKTGLNDRGESVSKRLVKINNQSENDTVAGYLKGAYDATWVNCAKVNGNWSNCGYTNWAPGEPNNANGNERHAAMLKGGKWNDTIENDTNANKFVCEHNLK